MKLKDKVAIVTGARRGIGKAIALKLAEEGAKVAVTDISKEDCQGVVEEIESLGSQGLALELDVTKEDKIESVFEEVRNEFGKIDILVNNAGIYIQKNMEEMETSEINKMLDINLRGALQCIKNIVPEMKENKYGKIVNIASIAGLVGFDLSSVYCASKGALVNLTRELALELGSSNVNVNAVAPGVIETEMTKDMLSDEETKKSLLSNIPYGRVGKPEDIASAVSFLCSDESEYITGQILAVDGGMAHSLIMVLKVENLKVSGEKKEILKGVDLNIGKGEIQALIGPNASGKSTLAHVLSGNSKYKIKEGKIYFKGKNIKNYSPERRVKMGLALSWQDPPSIKGVGFFHFLSEISKGKIDDSFVENFKERDLNLNFSGGEKKLSEIAQIIALKPDLVILDEIDSGLDMEKIREISKIIKEKILKNNVSLLLITHSCEIFNFLKPHYVNVMVGGKIICKKRDYKEVLRTIKKYGYEKCRQKISLPSS